MPFGPQESALTIRTVAGSTWIGVRVREIGGECDVAPAIDAPRLEIELEEAASGRWSAWSLHQRDLWKVYPDWSAATPGMAVTSSRTRGPNRSAVLNGFFIMSVAPSLLHS